MSEDGGADEHVDHDDYDDADDADDDEHLAYDDELDLYDPGLDDPEEDASADPCDREPPAEGCLELEGLGAPQANAPESGPPRPQPQAHTDPPAAHPAEHHHASSRNLRAPVAATIDPFDTPFDALERLSAAELRALAAAAREMLYLDIVAVLSERLPAAALEELTPTEIVWHHAEDFPDADGIARRRTRLDVLESLVHAATAANEPKPSRHKRRRR